MPKTILAAFMALALSLVASPLCLSAGERVDIPETLEAVTDQAILSELQKEIPYYNYLSSIGDKGVYYKNAYEKVHGKTPEFSSDVAQLIEAAAKARTVTSSPVTAIQSSGQTYTNSQAEIDAYKRQVAREYGVQVDNQGNFYNPNPRPYYRGVFGSRYRNAPHGTSGH